jgi:phosphate transport system ATP-binding protein
MVGIVKRFTQFVDPPPTSSRAEDDVHPDHVILDVRGLNVSIDDVSVVRDLNLKIARRTVTALFGPCGSGKSVFLKTLVGLFREEVPPKTNVVCSGEAIFEGQNTLAMRASELRQLRRRVIYLGQQAVAFPGSIFENVTVGLRYWNPTLSIRECQERTEMALKQAALWNAVKNKLSSEASTLSTGQLQLLAIARAMAQKPEILLLDEPCASIDPAATGRIEDLLFELKQTVSVLIVTHNMQQAARTAEFSSFVLSGQLIEAGKTKQIFTNPNEKETEDFLTGRFG